MILKIERGSTRSHSVEKSLWKRLRTCRKTNYAMNDTRNFYDEIPEVPHVHTTVTSIGEVSNRKTELFI